MTLPMEEYKSTLKRRRPGTEEEESNKRNPEESPDGERTGRRNTSQWKKNAKCPLHVATCRHW